MVSRIARVLLVASVAFTGVALAEAPKTTEETPVAPTTETTPAPTPEEAPAAPAPTAP